jgi:pimeloyl-ACP methyl ester carboxylesterase
MTNTAPAVTDVRYEQADLQIDGVDLNVAMAGRGGGLAPVVFLHGFGSTKEDYLDIACQPAFTGRPFLAYDANPVAMWERLAAFVHRAELTSVRG